MEPEGIGSVKAAISIYGQIYSGSNKEDLHSDSGELQKAQFSIGRLKETKVFAENEKTKAELELYKARSEAKELARAIDKSNAKAMSRNISNNDQKYYELMQELSSMKQELSKLKLEVGIALESKSKAEKMIEESNSKAKYYTSSAEKISREIDEANEEHVLVELARIEAEKETREIESQRKAEIDKFSKEIEATKEKISLVQKEVNQAKDLEMKLEVTNADLSVLQNEMEFVRAMEINFQKKIKFDEESKIKEAKKELESIREEAFRFMTSMDVIRKELMYTTKETDQLSKQEKKADSTIQQLNARLIKAKSKLESASIAEERSKAIVSNLLLALDQLRKEMDDVKKEKERITEETKRAKLKFEISENEIIQAEEKLQAAMAELQNVKALEANAIKQLKDVAESTMKTRAFSFQQSPNITISNSEYEYLANRGKLAKEVADKKVEAAQAWIEALKAEEKEILMKTELVKKETKQLKIEDYEEHNILEKPEFSDILKSSTPKVTTRENRTSMTLARRKARRSSVSSNIRYNARSPSFTIKKRTTVMPSLAKLLRKQK